MVCASGLTERLKSKDHTCGSLLSSCSINTKPGLNLIDVVISFV